jgi:hypothetical protein
MCFADVNTISLSCAQSLSFICSIYVFSTVPQHYTIYHILFHIISYHPLSLSLLPTLFRFTLNLVHYTKYLRTLPTHFNPLNLIPPVICPAHLTTTPLLFSIMVLNMNINTQDKYHTNFTPLPLPLRHSLRLISSPIPSLPLCLVPFCSSHTH